MKRTTARLRQLCELVVSVYGPQSRAGYSFLNALEALDRLHLELEVQAVSDVKGYVEKLYS
ncbi:MAG: hypothetical protein JST11_08370 [Acidobacteria bacterium]|nr:hypothetical protein [Acidobacteriota bacterium]